MSNHLLCRRIGSSHSNWSLTQTKGCFRPGPFIILPDDVCVLIDSPVHGGAYIFRFTSIQSQSSVPLLMSDLFMMSHPLVRQKEKRLDIVRYSKETDMSSRCIPFVHKGARRGGRFGLMNISGRQSIIAQTIILFCVSLQSLSRASRASRASQSLQSLQRLPEPPGAVI